MSGNIDKIIESISKAQDDKVEKNKYVVDVRKVLEKLKVYEIDTSMAYEDNSWSSAVNYYDKVLKPIAEEWVAGNSFNNGGRMSNDIQYFYYENEDCFYIAFCVNIGGEIRNFANYTSFCLLKFDTMEDFREKIYDIEREVSSFDIMINNRHYWVAPHMFNENLEVHCIENGDEFDIWANSDNELKSQISKLIKTKEKIYANKDIVEKK